MKRPRVKQYENPIRKWYTLFQWKPCCKCKQEFRRERGWAFLGGPYYNGRGRWYFLCQSCAPTKERANELAVAEVFIPPRPPAPPTMRSAVVPPARR